jgi:uncharacterized protein YecT (DUF1311 family)
MLATLILAAALDAATVCAKVPSDWRPPEVALKLWSEECDNNFCDVTLAERFANGDGVARDFDLAERFLCVAREDIAPAEFDGMFEHLQRMRAGTETAPLAFCDYVTSGYGSTYCASARFDVAMADLDARLATLGRARSSSITLPILRERAAAFIEAETERISIQSRGGTGNAAMTLDAEVHARTQFVETLERISRERAPVATADAEKAADKALNDAYKAHLRQLEDLGEELPEWQERVRAAQRAWIRYRDAMAAYYAERWMGRATPGQLRREIVTLLSLARAAELREG